MAAATIEEHTFPAAVIVRELSACYRAVLVVIQHRHAVYELQFGISSRTGDFRLKRPFRDAIACVRARLDTASRFLRLSAPQAWEAVFSGFLRPHAW